VPGSSAAYVAPRVEGEEAGAELRARPPPLDPWLPSRLPARKGGGEDGAPAVAARARRERERRSERGKPGARGMQTGVEEKGIKKIRVGPVVGMEEGYKG
jgi:hypothetical protein